MGIGLSRTIDPDTDEWSPPAFLTKPDQNDIKEVSLPVIEPEPESELPAFFFMGPQQTKEAEKCDWDNCTEIVFEERTFDYASIVKQTGEEGVDDNVKEKVEKLSVDKWRDMERAALERTCYYQGKCDWDTYGRKDCSQFANAGASRGENEH